MAAWPDYAETERGFRAARIHSASRLALGSGHPAAWPSCPTAMAAPDGILKGTWLRGAGTGSA